MALVNPNIAMSYRGVEVPQQNMLADYAAVQQIQSGQRQAEVSQMQIDAMRRDQAALAKMQAAITAKGGPSDLNVAAEEMINSGIPEYFKQGLVIKQTLDKQSRFAKLLGPTGGAAPAAAPASEAYPGYNEAIGMTNTLAPAPAAPVNAMADLRRKINEAYMIGTPEALAFAKAGEDQLKPTTDVSSMQALGFPSTPAGFAQFKGAQFAPAAPPAPPVSVAEFERAKTDPAFMKFLQDRAAATRPPRPEAAPRTQQVTLSDGSLGIVNMDTGVITPSTVGGATAKGKLSPFAEKTAAQKVQMGKDINQAIFELKNAAKTGGLIDKSTGSGAGRLYDVGAGFFGQAPEGAIAAGQLAPIADLVLKMVPRFEGPQSDKDTQSYKAAAGQLADSSLPTKIRKAAANEIIRLMEARKNQFGSADMPAPAGGGGVDTNNPLLK